MKFKIIFKKMRKEDGQSLVEFALVIPILLIFILGIIEYGWILNARITITSAAREGVRAAVVSSANRSTIAYNAIDNAVEGVSGITLLNDIKHYKYYELVDTKTNVNNAIIEITVNVKPLVGIFVSDPYPVYVKAVMRIE